VTDAREPRDDPRTALGTAELRGYLDFALSLADEVRAILAECPQFRTHRKADGSLVTELDERIERLLRARIARAYPDHAILGEEFGATGGEVGMRWIIDPIDGTEDFTRGIPTYGTLVALELAGKPLVAVVDHPALVLRSWASFGQGAFHNGERVSLREDGMGDGPVVLPAYADFNTASAPAGRFDGLVTAFPNYRVLRNCYGHTLAFTGAADGVVEYGVEWWDLAASRLIIEEAGGEFRSWRIDGAPAHGQSHAAAFGRRSVVEAMERVLEVVD
jgi:fructose-1,6-bisphosphatase/inositol monophosphatase family enzyme